nr:unnamed protein product [Spirometra erinaceieuropaei]
MPSFSDDYPLKQSCCRLEDLRKANFAPDLTIEVLSGQKVYAHRIILAARIPTLQESLANPGTSLSWSSYSQSVVESLLEYVYTGTVSISQDNAQNLLRMAKTLHMDTLEEWCIQFLIKSINLANLSNLWELSQDTNCAVLQESCLAVMRRIFEDFVFTDLFASLSAEALFKLLDSDDLRAPSEEAVLQSVLDWMTKDQERTSGGGENTRVEYLHRLLPAIRWSEVPDENRKKLCHNPFIQADPKCLTYLEVVNAWIEKHTGLGEEACPFIPYPRIKGEELCLVLGPRKTLDEPSWTVEAYDPSSGHGQAVGSMKHRFDSAIVMQNGSLYVIGGWDEHSRCRSVEVFNPMTATFASAAPMHFERSCHGAAAVGHDSIVVCGGENEAGPVRSCELLNTRLDKWIPIPDMRRGVQRHCVVALDDGRVFVIGGMTETVGHAADVVYCKLAANTDVGSINPTDFWMQAAPLNVARHSHSAAVVGDRIVVVGGFDLVSGHTNTVEMFTPPCRLGDLGQWTKLSPLSPDQNVLSLTVCSGRPIAFGEEGRTFVLGPKATVKLSVCSQLRAEREQKPDLEAWQWTELPKLSFVSCVQAAVATPRALTCYKAGAEHAEQKK